MISEVNNKIIFKDIESFNDLDLYIQSQLKDKLYLILLESRIANSKQYNKKYHKYFQKILTWNDRLVDNQKYFKFNIPQLIYNTVKPYPFNQKRLGCIINNNKIGINKYELYSVRKETILHFQKYFDDFDVYGEGWNEKQLKIISFLHCCKNIKQMNWNRFKFALDYFFNIKNVDNYKGIIGGLNNWIESAKECSKIYYKYKFALCYENIYSDPGYISEKIFNCLNARCVPIYLGAPNIEKYIPRGCYIDVREFKSNKELINYICVIENDEKIYNEYIKNIDKFLNSDQVKKFSIENYNKRIKQVFGV